MYGFPRPLKPNEIQWNRHQAPYNPQWRPFHRPRAPFRPRNQGYYNNSRPLMMQGSSEDHWCETCDRGFPTEDLLNKHKQQHQKCNIDGCQFIAHPKVITKHIQMQHSSGLYKKIAKLNNPEEIDKWREERKKKYPTKTNIDKRAAELKEKIDRGEKMGLRKKHWGNNQDTNKQNFNQGLERKRAHSNDNKPESKFRKPNRKQTPRTPKILPATEENRSLAPFAGIQSLVMDSDEEGDEILSCNDIVIEDDVVEVIDSSIKHDDEPNGEKLVVCGALSSLMCDYGSSDEEIDNINTKQDDKKELCIKVAVKKIMPQHINNAAEKVTNVPEFCNKTIDNVGIKVKVEVVTQQTNNVAEMDHKTIDNVEIKVKELLKPEQIINDTEKVKNTSDFFCVNSKQDIENKVDATEDDNERGPEVLVSKIENPINESNIIRNFDEQSTNQNNKPDLDKHGAVINDDDSEPEEVKVVKNVDPTSIIAQQNNSENESKCPRKRFEIVRKPVYRKPKPKLPSTLIYRLLSKEMKQERNKVLQCIRYIRKKNYFDKSI